MDIGILQWLQETLRSDVLDTIMVAISALGNSGIFWIILTLILLVQPKTRNLGWMMAAALVCSVLICNVALKNLVARPRPFTTYPGVTLALTAPLDFSFPSGHTQASFAAAGILLFNHVNWGKAAMVLAGLIAFSRLYLYVHYPTDVLAGIVIGLLIAWGVTKVFRRYIFKDGSGKAVL